MIFYLCIEKFSKGSLTFSIHLVLSSPTFSQIEILYLIHGVGISNILLSRHGISFECLFPIMNLNCVHINPEIKFDVVDDDNRAF